MTSTSFVLAAFLLLNCSRPLPIINVSMNHQLISCRVIPESMSHKATLNPEYNKKWMIARVLCT